MELAAVRVERRVATHADDAVGLVEEDVTTGRIQVGGFHQGNGKVFGDPAKAGKAAQSLGLFVRTPNVSEDDDVDRPQSNRMYKR